MPYRNKQTKTAATESSAKMEPKMKSLKIAEDHGVTTIGC